MISVLPKGVKSILIPAWLLMIQYCVVFLAGFPFLLNRRALEWIEEKHRIWEEVQFIY